MRKIIIPKAADVGEYLLRFGGYNEAPPNLVEISADEYYRKMLSSEPDYLDTRQFAAPGCKVYQQFNLAIWTHDKTGLAVTYLYPEWGHTFNKENFGKKEGPRYYKFAVCDHSYTEIPSQGSKCLHLYRCTKCNHEFRTDSGD